MSDGHAVLQVPVPALERVVRARHQHYDPAYVSGDPLFTHAHITVLGPLPVLDETGLELVAAIARTTTAFAFTLAGLAAFPGGVIHLAPEPSSPFTELTRRMSAAFPDHPPYAGEFAPVPHLTVDAWSETVTLTSTAALLVDVVPARCRATRIDLAWWGPGTCRLVQSWPLTGSG